MERQGRVVELCALIVDYVEKFTLPSDIRKKINLADIRTTDIDFSQFFVSNKETRHEPGKTSNMKSHVLFSSVFTNSTSEPQTNHMNTERRTSSSCRICLQKAVTKEGSLQLQIGPPNTSLQLNGGFRKEVTMGKELERVFEEEIVWTLNTEVVVPPGSRTRANLVIMESEYDGTFRVETIFEGKIIVNLRDKKSGSIIYKIVIPDLSKVFTKQLGFDTLPDNPRAVCFISQGVCHCNYGISQTVELHEEKI